MLCGFMFLLNSFESIKQAVESFLLRLAFRMIGFCRDAVEELFQIIQRALNFKSAVSLFRRLKRFRDAGLIQDQILDELLFA